MPVSAFGPRNRDSRRPTDPPIIRIADGEVQEWGSEVPVQERAAASHLRPGAARPVHRHRRRALRPALPSHLERGQALRDLPAEARPRDGARQEAPATSSRTRRTRRRRPRPARARSRRVTRALREGRATSGRPAIACVTRPVTKFVRPGNESSLIGLCTRVGVLVKLASRCCPGAARGPPLDRSSRAKLRTRETAGFTC